MKTGELKQLKAVFVKGAIPAWATDIGLQTFDFKGLPIGISPEQRLSFFDTHQAQAQDDWTNEEREIVEDFLRQRVEEVGVGAGFVIVEQPKLAAPWPTYDRITIHGQRKAEHVAAKIVEMVSELGIDPAGVIAYERQERNNPIVIAELEKLLDPTEEQAEELVEA